MAFSEVDMVTELVPIPFGQRFYVRMKVYDGSDSSDWTAIVTAYNYSRPTLARLSNGFSGNFEKLIWTNSRATGYEIQADTSDNFNSSLLVSYRLDTPQRTDLAMDSILFNAGYNWRVRAFYGQDTSEWSEEWTFVLSQSVTLVFPASGSNFASSNSGMFVKWSSKYMGNVELQTSKSDDFSSGNRFVSIDASTETEGHILDMDYEDQHYVRMRLYNKLDTLSWQQGGMWRTHSPRIIEPFNGKKLE